MMKKEILQRRREAKKKRREFLKYPLWNLMYKYTCGSDVVRCKTYEEAVQKAETFIVRDLKEDLERYYKLKDNERIVEEIKDWLTKPKELIEEVYRVLPSENRDYWYWENICIKKAKARKRCQGDSRKK